MSELPDDLVVMLRAFAEEPAPEPGEVVPASVLHDLAKRVLGAVA